MRRWSTKIPSLHLLPVAGIDDDLQNIRMARQRLNTTRIILNEIHGAPAGLPSVLRREIQNINFHVLAALSHIESFLFAGHTVDEPITGVPGLRESISLHILAIRQAKLPWDQWANAEKGAPTPPLAESAVNPMAGWGFGAEEAKPESALQELNKPTPLKTYLFIGGIGIAALLVLKMLE